MDWIRLLTVQWHITPRCGNNCRHCYVHEGATYASEVENELDLAELLRCLESIISFERTWKAQIPTMYITGGDPFLHPEWMAFFRELRAHGKRIFIFGNPEHLTDENLEFLRKMEVVGYQMSLDGLEEVHDHVRSPGSFRRTVEAIEKLKACGIPVHIMFTLYPYNKDQFIPLFRHVVTTTGASVFNFDIGACTGNAGSLKESLGRDELRELLALYRREKKAFKEAGCRKRIFEKTTLFRMIRYEEYLFYPFAPEELPVVSGCLCGWTSIAVISDGTVMACRRAPSVAGKMPEQTFSEIFLESELLKRFRRPQYYKGCGACAFYMHCRGCPTTAYGMTKDLFSPYPHCFLGLLERKPPRHPSKPHSIPMNTTADEERDLVARHFGNVYRNRREDFLDDGNVQKALSVIRKGDERLLFLAEPDDYLKRRGLSLSELQRLAVYRLSKERAVPSRCRSYGTSGMQRSPGR
ncbi:MAG: radical SAM protein [Candidatus Eremiobacteraeota bacterium]|nr:radical SAM protein [Candidatus Eremiobacteraeota bacterium]